ncbi:MAG: hypothetical protein WCO72_14195, partial [Betaproteobacteria bacterium]
SWKVTPLLCKSWNETMGEIPLPVLPGEAAIMPAGLLVLMFSNYMDAMVPPRPPGMIYAAQKLTYGEPAREGDTLITVLSVHNKFIKRERLFVEIDSQTVNDHNQFVASGIRTVIWGA